jgi:hypothetical protein
MELQAALPYLGVARVDLTYNAFALMSLGSCLRSQLLIVTNACAARCVATLYAVRALLWILKTYCCPMYGSTAVQDQLACMLGSTAIQ